MGKGKVVFSVRAGRGENGRIRTELRCHLPPVVRAVRGRCTLHMHIQLLPSVIHAGATLITGKMGERGEDYIQSVVHYAVRVHKAPFNIKKNHQRSILSLVWGGGGKRCVVVMGGGEGRGLRVGGRGGWGRM